MIERIKPEFLTFQGDTLRRDGYGHLPWHSYIRLFLAVSHNVPGPGRCDAPDIIK